MINNSDKTSIKRIIGYRYALVVQKELVNSKEYNRGGTPYTTGHITNVMNGENHDIIEAAIFRVVENRLEIQKKRARLLHKKNLDGTEGS